MPTVQPEVLKTICQEIYRRFPEVQGVRPKVQAQADNATYRITFAGKATLPGRKSLPRLVNVVADARGKILRITTSR